MKNALRRLVCWWMKRCHRCLAPMIKVHHERDSPWGGMHFGWYQNGCSNRSCAGWIEPMLSR